MPYKTKRVIYKYPLELQIRNEVMMPRLARPRCVQMQRGRICLWVECYPENELTVRTFHIIGTGNTIPPEAEEYIGTVQDGEVVWHVYEGNGK